MGVMGSVEGGGTWEGDCGSGRGRRGNGGEGGGIDGELPAPAVLTGRNGPGRTQGRNGAAGCGEHLCYSAVSLYPAAFSDTAVLSLTVYDPEEQPAGDSAPCRHGNGGCQHLCFPVSPTEGRCRCAVGFTLQPDGTTCNGGSARAAPGVLPGPLSVLGSNIHCNLSTVC